MDDGVITLRPCKSAYISLCAVFLLAPITIAITCFLYSNTDAIWLILFSMFPIPIVIFFLLRYKVTMDCNTVTLRYALCKKTIQREEIVKTVLVFERGSPTICVYVQNNPKKPAMKIRVMGFARDDVAYMETSLGIAE